MAIVNSLAIGKSVKSAGNLTYKTVRGRTIASQRIFSNKSNTPNQQNQRQLFANVSASMRMLQQYINVCYEKSKYGSSRNAFFRTNKNFTLGGLVGEISEGLVTLSDGMLSALTAKPIPQLSALSMGSLAGFISIQYSTIATYKAASQTYNNLRVIGTASSYNQSSYTFRFASPVKRTDLSVAAFAFSPSGLIAGNGTFDNEGTFSMSGALGSALSDTGVVSLGDNYDYVSSITISANMTRIGDAPIAVVVPVVGGKVPSITGVFAKQSEE